MSKERARRREERERVAAAERAARERREARREERRTRQRSRRAAWRDRLPRRTRWRGQQGILARRRRMQNAGILGCYLVLQLVVWLLTADPWARLASAILGVLALPVLVTLVFDRRSRP